MSTISLNTASTGLKALNTSLEVTANNLANVNTTGFKASRVNFEDLVYIERAQPGLVNENGDRRPTGLQIGLGVAVSGTQLDLEQGPLEPTAAPLDVAIVGDGLFRVELPDGNGDGIGYTRAGNFVQNVDGDLVMATANGYRLVPSINIPDGASNITIDSTGLVQGLIDGNVEEIGQFEIARFVNPAGLRSMGGNVFVPTEASGDEETGTPAQDGYGELRQGFLEGSNVQAVEELVSLIKTQRAFEMNSQVIQAANETIQEVTNLRRF